MEHMLNRGRTRSRIANVLERLFFRSVLPIGRFERIRIAFGFLRVLQPGMKSPRCAPASLPPVLSFSLSLSLSLSLFCQSRLCLFAELFFCKLDFASVPSFFSVSRFSRLSLLRSRFYTHAVRLSAYLARSRARARAGFRYWNARARKNLYVVQCRRVNEFLRGRERSPFVPVKSGKPAVVNSGPSIIFLRHRRAYTIFSF